MIRVINGETIELIGFTGLLITLFIFDLELRHRVDLLIIKVGRHLEVLLPPKVLVLFDVKRIVDQLDLNLESRVLSFEIADSEAPLGMLNLEGA